MTVAAAIVGCEVGFWILLCAGLLTRYALHRRRASSVLLACLPLLDLALVVVVALDVHRGATITSIHRLASIYLGVTVAFGASMVQWADVRFAHRLAGGPAPTKPPKKGRRAMRREIVLFGRWLLAAVIALVVTTAIAVTVADSGQRSDLLAIAPQLAVITGVWLLAGPVWNLLFEDGLRRSR